MIFGSSSIPGRGLYDQKLQELDCRYLVRDQALGESLDPEKFEKLARYEVHVDRKLERMLSMLVRLQKIRGGDAMR